MGTKLVFVAIFVSMFGLQVVQSCRQPEDDRINRMDPNVGADLVFFFNKGTTSEEILEFQRTVTGIPKQKGSGHASLPGMMSGVAIRINGFDGWAERFQPDATDDEKTLIKKRISDSPLVYKVYENVIPARITDLR